MIFNRESFELILEGEASRRDYIVLSDGERLLKELNPGAGSGKGKNSCVFRASVPDEDVGDVIVKFCCYPEGVLGEDEVRKRARFMREIKALIKASEAQLGSFLIQYYEHGTHLVNGSKFDYYVMEKAECDLSDYLEKNRLPLQQKLVLCRSLLNDLVALHKLGIYHRDLKPDNVFFVGEQWKIGDLGFIMNRDEDVEIDGQRERIGPTGLMSPEAINKAYANLENSEFIHDCEFCDLSDVFLLGGVFWYILQGNFPIGQVTKEDFKIGREDIFNSILVPMLQHAKTRRLTLPDVGTEFEKLTQEFAL